jgi:hypothetical protein
VPHAPPDLAVSERIPAPRSDRRIIGNPLWEVKLDGKRIPGSGDRADLALPSGGERRDLVIQIKVAPDGAATLASARYVVAVPASDRPTKFSDCGQARRYEL